MFCFLGFREAKTLAPQGAIPFKIRWQRFYDGLFIKFCPEPDFSTWAPRPVC
jgi:hypothetical protein